MVAVPAHERGVICILMQGKTCRRLYMAITERDVLAAPVPRGTTRSSSGEKDPAAGTFSDRDHVARLHDFGVTNRREQIGKRRKVAHQTQGGIAPADPMLRVSDVSIKSLKDII